LCQIETLQLDRRICRPAELKMPTERSLKISVIGLGITAGTRPRGS
jgi:hypothetical protein